MISTKAVSTEVDGTNIAGTEAIRTGGVGSLAEGVGTDRMGAGGVGSLTEGVGTDCVGAEGVGADFVARCSLLLFSMASRASR